MTGVAPVVMAVVFGMSMRSVSSFGRTSYMRIDVRVEQLADLSGLLFVLVNHIVNVFLGLSFLLVSQSDQLIVDNFGLGFHAELIGHDVGVESRLRDEVLDLFQLFFLLLLLLLPLL